MITKSQITEIGLLIILFIGLILKIYDINADYFLFLNLFALNVFWFFRSKLFNEIVKPIQTTEKQLISILIWGITLNLCEISNSTLFIELSFLIIAVFFLIKFFRKRKNESDWLVKNEPLIFSILFFAFFLKYMHYPGAGLLLILSFVAYSTLLIGYGISIFKKNSDYKNGRSLFLLQYIALSVLMISILFYTMYWNGAGILFWNSLISTVVIGVILAGNLFNKTNIKDDYTIIIRQTFKRVLTLVYTTGVLFSLFLYQR